MDKRQDDIKINYGEIFLYFPFQFLEYNDLEEIHNRIISNSLFNENYLKQIDEELEGTENFIIQETCRILEENKKIKVNKEEGRISLETDYDYKEFITYVNEIARTVVKQYNILSDDYKLQIDFIDGNLKFFIEYSGEKEAYNSLFDFSAIKKIESKTYSSFFNEKHKRYVVRPVEIINRGGKNSWLRTELLVFGNGMGVFKLNFSIENADTASMKNNSINDYFEKIEVNKQTNFEAFDDYATYLYSCFFGDKDAFFGRTMDLIALVDIDCVLNNVNNVPDQLIKEAYLITNSPVPKVNHYDCLKQAKEHFESNSFSLSQILYIVRTTGGCLVIPSEKCVEEVCKDKKELGIAKKEINHILARSICCSTEFSLMIMMLDNLNGKSTLHSLSTDSTDEKNVTSNYLNNKLFINNLQDGCYGSVINQISDFKRMMYLYKQEMLINESIEIRKVLITSKQMEEKDKLNTFISIGSFIFMLVFGLPTIYESLMIVRSQINGYDLVPNLTIEQVSMFIWITLLILFGKWVKIFKRVKNMVRC